MSETPVWGNACSNWARAIRKSGVSHSRVASACDASTSGTRRSLRTGLRGRFARGVGSCGGDRRGASLAQRNLAQQERNEEGRNSERDRPQEDGLERVRNPFDETGVNIGRQAL